MSVQRSGGKDLLQKQRVNAVAMAVHTEDGGQSAQQSGTVTMVMEVILKSIWTRMELFAGDERRDVDLAVMAVMRMISLATMVVRVEKVAVQVVACPGP